MKDRKIKLLFDAEPMANSKKTGVGYYTELLIESLAKLGPEKIELIGHYFYQKNNIPTLPEAKNIKYVKSKFIPKKIINLLRRYGIETPFEFLIKSKGDLILYTNFIGTYSIFNTPSMDIVYDLSFLIHPGFVSSRNKSDLTRFVPKSIQRASLIITISEQVKDEIVENLSVSSKKIVVTPIPPPEPFLKISNDYLKELKIDSKYILFVGTLEPRKNIVNLIKAYNLLPESIRESYSLVLAGGSGWNNQSIEDELDKNYPGIIPTGYINDEQKASLYKNASLFILPSHYEGFGMPVLEAFSYNVPTILSDIPVFHEIAGNTVNYFDQNDPDSIKESIIKELTNKESHKKDYDNILLKINWDKIAKDLYEQMLLIKK
jgi:glycosyltransferase involved in cell wall biosynthesis